MIVSNVDEVATNYAKALDDARTLDQLRTAVRLYGEVAMDAVQIVDRFDVDDFMKWRGALAMERRGRFCGDKYPESDVKKFLPVIMPEVMFKISIVAEQFKAPWGLAYNRLKEVGRLKVKHGVAELVEAP